MGLVVDIYRLLLTPFLVNKRLKTASRFSVKRLHHLHFSSLQQLGNDGSYGQQQAVHPWPSYEATVELAKGGFAPRLIPRRPILGLKRRRQTAHD